MRTRGQSEPVATRLRALHAELGRLNRRSSVLQGAYEDVTYQLDQTLSAVHGDRDIALDSAAGRPAVAKEATRPLAARIVLTPRPEGDYDAQIDQHAMRLSSVLAEILAVLSLDEGRRLAEHDPCVGFKTAPQLLQLLSERFARQHSRHSLVAAISRLRRRLAARLTGGDWLVHTRPRWGWRAALIRPSSLAALAWSKPTPHPGARRTRRRRSD